MTNNSITVNEQFRRIVHENHAKRSPSKMYIPATDKKALITTCGDASYVLYEFYMSRYNDKTYPFTDKASAKALGWTERKTKGIRLKLTRSNWFAVKKFKSNDGDKITQYYLGPETVIQHRLAKKAKQKVVSFAYAKEMYVTAGIYNTSKRFNRFLLSIIKAGYIDKDDPDTLEFIATAEKNFSHTN